MAQVDFRLFYDEERMSSPNLLQLLLQAEPVKILEAFIKGIDENKDLLVEPITSIKGMMGEPITFLSNLMEKDPVFTSFMVADGLRRLLPTIGFGLIVKESKHLKSLGLSGEGGLYATRTFEKGEIITTYYGRVVRFVPTDRLDLKKQTHAKSLFFQRYTIIGNEMMPAKQGDIISPITSPNEQLKGLGGAAMANDGVHGIEESKLNSMFKTCDLNYKGSPMDPNPFAKLILLVAERRIERGEEILNDYEEMYWERMENPRTKPLTGGYIEPKTVFPHQFLSSSPWVRKIEDLEGSPQKTRKKVVPIQIPYEPVIVKETSQKTEEKVVPIQIPYEPVVVRVEPPPPQLPPIPTTSVIMNPQEKVTGKGVIIEKRKRKKREWTSQRSPYPLRQTRARATSVKGKPKKEKDT